MQLLKFTLTKNYFLYGGVARVRRVTQICTLVGGSPPPYLVMGHKSWRRKLGCGHGTSRMRPKSTPIISFFLMCWFQGEESESLPQYMENPHQLISLLHWNSHSPVSLKRRNPFWAILMFENKLLHTCRISSPSRGPPYLFPKELLPRLCFETGIPKSSHNCSFPTPHT